MERGNDVGQAPQTTSTTANVGTMSGKLGEVKTDVGGVDMGGLSINVAGAGAGRKTDTSDDNKQSQTPGRATDDDVGDESTTS